MAAVINENKCNGCGICAEICPVKAIAIDLVAKIDKAICIDCGSCVAECPNDAISMDMTDPERPVRRFDSPTTVKISAIPNAGFFEMFTGQGRQGKGRNGQGRRGRVKSRGWQRDRRNRQG